MSIQPLEIRIPDATLLDLQARLDRTRLSPDDDARDWEAGMSPAYLHELVEYWRTGFDWRAQEAHINGPSGFRVARGRGDGATRRSGREPGVRIV